MYLFIYHSFINPLTQIKSVSTHYLFVGGQGRHLRGAGGAVAPRKKKKDKKKEKKEKKEKREKNEEEKERKKEGNYEKRQITTYKVLFFQFFNSP